MIMTMPEMFKVALLTTVIGLTTGFIPTSPRLTVANKLFKSNGQTSTHPDITLQAFLQTAAEIFISNPNPNYPSSSDDIQQLLNSNKGLDISKLIDAYYSNESPGLRKKRKENFCTSVGVVIKYNGKVDMDELKIASAHFDSEQFKYGQRRLVKYRNMASLLIKEMKYNDARMYTGRLLHTLQDFYSHTNWVENWVDEVGTINPYNVLGESEGDTDKEINAATLANPCLDCRRTDSLSDSLYTTLLDKLSFGRVVESRSIYECNNNIDVSLKTRKQLTSGYSNGGKDDDNEVIIKPQGKCSHGGIIDGSTDQPARGGINKDSTHPYLASHHHYHRKAAKVAEQHSHEFLLRMRNDVQNDKRFSEFLGLEVQVFITIAVVLDTTLRTDKNLSEIQMMISQSSANIKRRAPDVTIRYILTPLSDTGK